MKCIIPVTLLLTLFRYSFQSELSTFDLAKITRAIFNLKDVPKLLDYGDSESSSIAEDLASYNSGLNNEDAHLNMTQLVTKYGFKVEVHTVTTADGYILTLFRIFSDLLNQKRVAYIQHGILGSSVDWIMAQEQSLPYVLAAQGYDVWLGNARGNTFSRKHVSLSPDDPKFWDFSWAEMGIYDLPASIDYILAKTGQEKLFYIGFSQGTTSFFVMCSALPKYNDKIWHMSAFAPIAFVANMKSPLLRILAYEHDLEYAILTGIGVYEIAPSNLFTKTLAAVLCANNPVSAIFCNILSNLICGFDREQLDLDYLYPIYQHFPSGSATKQVQHYAQLIMSGQFRAYDYGEISKNVDKYGSVNPPDYEVGKITTPVHLYYSTSDWISSEKDVNELADNLGNVGVKKLVDNYNHLDYTWAKNVKEKVYDQVLDMMNNVSVEDASTNVN